MINSNSKPRRQIAIGIAIVALVAITLGSGWWFLGSSATATPTAFPQATPPAAIFTPPVSLDDLANQYPQIADLLRDPTLGTAYKEFLVRYQQGGLPAAEELARERGILSQNREVRITLALDSAASVPAVTAELEKLGVAIEGTYEELVDIAVPWQLIEQMAQSGDPGRVFSQLTTLNHVQKLRLPRDTRPKAIGNLAMEGASETGATEWHKAGFTGRGVKIGVLDLGFDGYKALLGKTLPANVTVKSFSRYWTDTNTSGEEHGTACAEIVYAMAPGAELYLADASSLATIKQAADWMAQQGVQIISHSAGGSVAPMDGTGAYARMVDDLAAKGILWVNAMGNEGDAHYRFTLQRKNDGTTVFPNGATYIRYYPEFPGDAEIVLTWTDWTAKSEDYDMYVYDGDTLVAPSEESQRGLSGDTPAEGVEFVARKPVYFIRIIARRAARAIDFDLVALGNGKFEFNTEGYSIVTPADARGSLSVGAVGIGRNRDRLEPYSSQGPTYDGRTKPEMSAPAGVAVAAYSRPFYGTSAATPHVAGAAALVWSRFPTKSLTELKDFLYSNAYDLGSRGIDNQFGYGRLRLPAPSAQVPSPTFTTAARAPSPSATFSRVPSPTFTGSPRAQSPTATSTATTLRQPTVTPTEAVPENASQEFPIALAFLGVLGCGAGFAGVVLLLVATRVREPRPPSPMPMSPPMRAPMPPYTPPAPVAYPPIAPQAPVLVSQSGQRFTLRPGRNQIGRSAQNQIFIDDPQVSRTHAVIAWNGVRCIITDLGSSNGTYVNGQRLTPQIAQMLNPGDRVGFGGGGEWTLR